VPKPLLIRQGIDGRRFLIQHHQAPTSPGLNQPHAALWCMHFSVSKNGQLHQDGANQVG
jgi:hypothetical protein